MGVTSAAVALWVGLLGVAEAAVAQDGAPRWDPILAIDDVRSLAGVVVLDARAPGDYAAGHIPGAIPIRWTDFRAGLLRDGRLPADLNDTARRLAAIGVDERARVLVCGDPRTAWGEEGRIAWMLRTLGHPQVALLDGGCTAWREAKRPWTREPHAAPPAQFRARPVPSLRASAEDVARAIGDPKGAQLVDTRTPAEYGGANPHFEARGGHVPGARSLWIGQLVNADGRYLRGAALRAELVRAGIDPKRPVIAYCTGGVRSALLTELLRADGIDARNYDGSMWEWSADPKRPLTKGSTP
jgi:thiosulfate/3-mercaptopyruvate sulfurtransferase